MIRTAMTGCFLAVLATGPAVAACEKLQGEVIYEDAFADNLGGWDLLPPNAVIRPPELVLDPGAEDSTSIAVQVTTFSASDGTYCLDMVLPPAPEGNRIAVGLIFWAKDYSNENLFQIDTDKQASLWRLSDQGGWTGLVPLTVTDSIKLAPDGANEIKINVSGTTLALSINGTEFKKIRAQKPAGDLRFGVYAQLDAKATLPEPVIIKQFRVVSETSE